MKATTIFIIALSAIMVSMPAEARRKKRNKPQPEPWPEEVPDYAAKSVADSLTRPKLEPMPVTVFDVVPESEADMVEFLMSQPIMGEPVFDAERLYNFVAHHNPGFDRTIAKAYIEVGRRYGIRGDIALCQSILETGWFMFADGTSVTPSQHNYCGLGVLSRGQRGHSFKSVEEGVTAQIQHLFAYACASPLPDGETLIDPRFKLVSRGVAPTWSELSGRWAANDRYARSIMKLFVELQRFSAEPDVKK